MDTRIYLDHRLRHDVVVLTEATHSNPNGDPDMGNQPRMDPETEIGLITDVAHKRRLRDYIALCNESLGERLGIAWDQERAGIYVQNDMALNAKHQAAYDHLKIKSTGNKQKRADVERVLAELCKRFYDVRTLGAMMATDVNAGSARGPWQWGFAQSINPITVHSHALTRSAVTTEEDARVVVAENGQGKGGKLGTMADKYTVPYALYRAHGFFNPLFAAKTGVTREDMAVMWDALEWGWEYTRSAARPEMATRGLYVFSHDSVLGRAHAHELFGRIKVVLRPGVEHPRSFSDYEVVINDVDLPKGVTLTRLVPREE